MDDRELERFIRVVREGAGDPPEPPLQEMWDRISEGTRQADGIEGGGMRLQVGRDPRADANGRAGARSGMAGSAGARAARPRVRGALAIAASLVIGFAVGRWVDTVGPGPGSTPTQVAGAAAERSVGPDGQSIVPARSEGIGAPRPVLTRASAVPEQVADRLAQRHFAEAGALFTLLAVGEGQTLPSAEVRSWARELVNQARFLEQVTSIDPDTRDLVEDVELVLIQLAALPDGSFGGAGPEDLELDLIRQGMDRNQVLDRIDSRLPTTNGDREE